MIPASSIISWRRGWLQNPGPLVEAVVASRRSGALRKAVYHNVANDAGKNLRDCVKRVDGCHKAKPNTFQRAISGQDAKG